MSDTAVETARGAARASKDAFEAWSRRDDERVAASRALAAALTREGCGPCTVTVWWDEVRVRLAAEGTDHPAPVVVVGLPCSFVALVDAVRDGGAR